DAGPRVIFTDPEVGCVGLTQSDALLKGFRVKTGTFHFRGLGRAHASGEIAGFAKIVADEKDDRVLGVHIIGAHASELVHSGCFIVGKKLTTREASDMLYAHPVFSEVIAEALWDVHGEAIHKL
ncbi:MAG: dihydrolipoyl dehydrogenase, partial [Nitrospinota bacterium]